MANNLVQITDIPRIRPVNPGFCYLYLVEWNSVSSWPIVNLQTGIINEKVVASKPWKRIEMYGSIKVQDKDGPAGVYAVTELTGLFRATSSNMMITTELMRKQQWVLVAKEKNDILWLVGDKISGAVLRSVYESTDLTRTLSLSFTWESESWPFIYSPLPARESDFNESDFSIKDFF